MVSPRKTANMIVLRKRIRSFDNAYASMAASSTPIGTLSSSRIALLRYVVAKLPTFQASVKFDQVNSVGQVSGPLAMKSASGRTLVISSSTSGEIQMTAAMDRTMVAVMPPLGLGGPASGSRVATTASGRAAAGCGTEAAP